MHPTKENEPKPIFVVQWSQQVSRFAKLHVISCVPTISKQRNKQIDDNIHSHAHFRPSTFNFLIVLPMTMFLLSKPFEDEGVGLVGDNEM